jgi:hypothetical protein
MEHGRQEGALKYAEVKGWRRDRLALVHRQAFISPYLNRYFFITLLCRPFTSK